MVYLSMAFGNEYNERWSVDILTEECARLRDMGVRNIALSDTIGVAYPASIAAVFFGFGAAVPRN